MQWLQRVLAVVVVAAGLALAVLPAAPAQAQATEQILDYRVDLQIEAAGTLLVTERIAYDFGTEGRHGIFRDVPVRFATTTATTGSTPSRYWGVWRSPGHPTSTRWRTWTPRCGSASATPTGPSPAARLPHRLPGRGGAQRVRRPRRAVLERHRHRLGGADRAGLGDGPGPGGHRPGGLLCRGPFGSTTSCAPSLADGPTASFAATGLGPKEGLTVVVGFPTGVVPAPRPILEERWSLARAFSVTPGTLGMAGGVLVAVLLVLGWLFGIVGRDRRPGERRRPVAGALVEAVPPQGIRPAQAGLLMDEVVNPVAIPATLVDLAVRGYLRIEEDAP